MFKPGITILFSALVLQSSVFAQIYVKNTGNVGIGVSQPLGKLELPNAGTSTLRVGVNSNMANTYAQFMNSIAVLSENNTATCSLGAVAWDYFNNGTNPSWAGTLLLHTGTGVGGDKYGVQAANQGTLLFQNVNNGVIATNGANIHIAPLNSPSASFLTNGNVGIGTTNPDFKFQVSGFTEIGDRDHDPTKYGALQLTRPANQGDDKFHLSFIRAGNAICGMGFANNSNNFGIWAYAGQGTNSPPIIGITPSLNVGIGTMSPAYKLDVAGSARADAFVAPSRTYADYVFNADYELPSLREIKEYIQQNHHLPEVPTEEEVKKTGINLGEQSVILLKKVEELTLYAIDQNEQLQSLEQKMNALLEENKKQKEEIEALKKNKTHR